MVGPTNSNEATELQSFFKQTVMKQETDGKWIPFPGGCSSYWLPFSDQVKLHNCDVKFFCFPLFLVGTKIRIIHQLDICNEYRKCPNNYKFSMFSKSRHVDFALSCNSSSKMHNVWEHKDRTLLDRGHTVIMHFITEFVFRTLKSLGWT